MKTAKEHFEDTLDDAWFDRTISRADIEVEMIEFAKLHVKAALEAAAMLANVLEEEILTSYPEENIK